MVTFALFIWAVGLIAILGVSRLAGLWPLRVTVPQLFIIMSLVMSYIGYPLLLLQVFEYRVATGISDPTLLATSIVAAAYSILVPMVLFWMVRGNNDRAAGDTPMLRKAPEARIWFWMLLLVFVLLVLLQYLVLVPQVALFEALSGGEVALARSDMTANFAGKYHWYALLFEDVSWLGALVLYAIARRQRRLRTWALFCFGFAVAAFGVTVTGQKSPLIWLVVTIVMTDVGLRTVPVVRIRGLLILTAISFVLLVGTYFGFHRVSGDSVVEAIASRGLTGQLAGGYNYQIVFPGRVDYLMGRSFPNPGGILPFESFRLTTEVMAMVNPEAEARGVTASQPTMYWGEAYANFGWWGVLVVPFFVGGVFVVSDNLVKRIAVPEARVAGTVWVGFQLARFAMSGFSWAFLPLALVTGMAVLLLHDVICSVGKQTTTHGVAVG